MFDVTAIGELLIDFTPNGENERGAQLFARNPGGAPANVLAMNTRLGGSAAFLGKVGQDGFGDFLRETLIASGIDVTGLVRDSAAPTTLAFVQLDATGDRSFSFYRAHSADLLLRTEEVNYALIDACHIFHFGSVALTDQPSRTTNFDAVAYAQAHGKLISFDPNYRPLLWKTEAEAVAQMLRGVGMTDILKVSEEEMAMLTGETDPARGARALLALGAALVLVSLGGQGSFFCSENACGLVPAYAVKVVDTNGAGDAFLGAALYRLRGKSRAQISAMDSATLTELVSFANAAGGLTTTLPGAIPAMPTLEQLTAFRAGV